MNFKSSNVILLIPGNFPLPAPLATLLAASTPLVHLGLKGGPLFTTGTIAGGSRDGADPGWWSLVVICRVHGRCKSQSGVFRPLEMTLRWRQCAQQSTSLLSDLLGEGCPNEGLGVGLKCPPRRRSPRPEPCRKGSMKWA